MCSRLLIEIFSYMQKAGDGNRTHISSLEGWCSTTELHLHKNDLFNSFQPERNCPSATTLIILHGKRLFVNTFG